MSSFICSPKHFSSIEHGLKSFCTSRGFNKYIFGKEYTNADISKFVESLKELNVLCVSFQYKHHFEGKLDKEIEEQRKLLTIKERPKPLSLHGLYNALCCVKYQCETEHLKGFSDNLVETTTKELDLFINELAHAIISTLPDDKTNTWSIN